LAALLSSASGPATALATVTFDWVTVGNPGNPADTLGTAYGTTGFGSVDHIYQISKYEVTNSQYVEFLNAVAPTNELRVYDADTISANHTGIIRSGESGSFTYSVKPGRGDEPVGNISWGDAARFVNWLSNGQGSGGTESGVYFTPQSEFLGRTRDAKIFLPTQDEWYKAAYYDPTLNGGVGGYYLYATQSNTAPVSQAPVGGVNSANYFNDDGLDNGINGGYALTGTTSDSVLDSLTDVGAYSNSSSYYGTFDQDGNVSEWGETRFANGDRAMDGGSWGHQSDALAASSFYGYDGIDPTTGFPGWGFRVARLPEPTSWVALLSLGGIALVRRRRITN
jgi:formylglycine-generating enzyme required for sulfatase activity